MINITTQHNGMRIAHIVCRYPPYYGGMGNVAFHMAEGLLAYGHDITVYTPEYYEAKEMKDASEPVANTHTAALEQHIVDVQRLAPSFAYGNAARLPGLRQELEQMDLVHLHYPFFGSAGLVMQWKKKHPDRPLIITYHMDPRSTGWKGLVFAAYARYMMPKILHLADAIHVSSFDYVQHSDAQYIYQQKPEVFFELPFGVDTTRFFPGEKSSTLCRKHAIQEQQPTIVFVGGMDTAHAFKGIPVFLDALLLLKRKQQCPQVIFVGDGDLRVSFEQQAFAYGLQSYVRFVGSVSHELLPDYYRMGDLFVLPSIHRAEAFGMVLLEAMASGLPVIASDLPGVRTIAKEGGLVVPPNNPSAIAAAIVSFFEAPLSFHTAKSQEVRKIVEKTYTWHTVCQTLDNKYRSLLP